MDDEGTLTVSGTGPMADYANASSTPWATEDIYQVVVEEGVTSVGQYAFAGLFLDNVRLPESMTSIGENAFYGASISEAHFAGNLKQWNDNVTVAEGNVPLLNQIEMEKDVTYDGDGLHLANGVLLIDHDDESNSYVVTDYFRTEYGPYTFSVVFAEGTVTIGWGAAEDLSCVTSVTIPDGVTNIGWLSFNHCTALISVTIPGSVTNISNYILRYSSHYPQS